MLIHKIQSIIITLMIILLFASCNRNTAILEEMGMAENLMDSKPDSALTILENIPVTNIKGKEIAARYALLKSIALDKNYIDTTTFDVLQPAIDYYLKKVLLTRNFGHIIIKAGYIRIKGMMIAPCNPS